jgi:hypothetical protein
MAIIGLKDSKCFHIIAGELLYQHALTFYNGILGRLVALCTDYLRALDSVAHVQVPRAVEMHYNLSACAPSPLSRAS